MGIPKGHSQRPSTKAIPKWPSPIAINKAGDTWKRVGTLSRNGASQTQMADPDPRTRRQPDNSSGKGIGSRSVTAAEARVSLWSAPESDGMVLATIEAAAREAGHNARRRDVRRNVRSHRQRLRAKGLRPVQLWLPDLRQAAAQEQARCQSRAVAWSRQSPPWSPSAPLVTIQRGELRVLRTDNTPAHVIPEQQLQTQGQLPVQPQIVAILLDNAFDELTTTLVCPLTTRLCRAPLLRVAVSPSAGNGLQQSHQLMVDALTTVPRPQLGACIGRLGDDVLKQLCQALMVIAGLAH